MKLSPREILFALSYQNKGEWKKILQDLKEKKPLSKEDIDYCHRACRNTYLSLLDEEYPSYFKEITHPPFLLYYYGNISLLHHPPINFLSSEQENRLFIKMTRFIN